MDTSNKWVISKAGVLNYWYYEEEEFPFEKGHLLIRGGNGSGKSVTTQSFLPLLLDGNKSPQRLDPFNTRSRKMIDYIFGESPEENEKTSYLYMEYKKPVTGEYITTGIGLKGNLSSDRVDSWYFIIKDKRINKDIMLYEFAIDENGEKVKIPLSEKKMKNLIEQEKIGEFKTSQADYAEAVNNNIFKFQSIEEFKEMVDLIVRIRAPKLSNNMGPSVLYDVLQSSLPDLSMNDLRSLSETIQNIDEINERLTKFKEDLTLITTLSSKYDAYNMAVLSQKAHQFISMKDKVKNSVKDIESARKEWKNSKEKATDKRKEVEALENEMGSLLQKVEHLKENDEYKMKRSLLELEKTKQALADEWKQLKKSLEDKERRIREVSISIKGKEDKKDEASMEITVLLDELDMLAEEMDYQVHSLNRDSFQTAFIQRAAIGATQRWEANLEEFQQQIETIIDILRNEENLNVQMDQQKSIIQEEEEQRDTLKKGINKQRDELESVLEQLNMHLASQNEKNKEYVLTKEELSYLTTSIIDLFEAVSVGEIKSLIQQFFFSRHQTLGSEELIINGEKETLKGRIFEKRKEIEKWENELDPVPSYRKAETEKARIELHKKKIPFLSFYEAVDFKPGLTDVEKERVESSLLEMGILDSLIVHPQYIHLVKECDSILIPSPLKGNDTLLQFLDINLPDKALELEIVTRDILRSIGISENEENSFVTNFGHYQHGIVKGFAVPREASIYIGKEARKKHRENMLFILRSELVEMDTMQSDLDIRLRDIKERIIMLRDEYERLLSLDAAEKLHEQIKAREGELKNLEKHLERLHQELTKLTSNYKDVQRELLKKTTGRKTPNNLSAYAEVVVAAKEYTSALKEIKQKSNDYNKFLEQLDLLQVQLEQAEIDSDEVRDLVLQKEREHKRIEREETEVRKTLSEKHVGDIEEQIENTERRIRKIPEIKDEILLVIGSLDAHIPIMENRINKLESSIRFHQEAFLWTKEIFVLELNRKLVESFDRDVLISEDDMIALAEAVIEDDKGKSNEKVQLLRDRMVETFNSVRVQGLEEYSLSLLDNEAPLKEIDDEGFEQFANELDRIDNQSRRQIIQLSDDGSILTPQQLQNRITDKIKAIQMTLTKEDEKLYKEVILDNIGERLRELIAQAELWNKEINDYMNQTKASNGLKLWLQWKPKKSSEDGEITTSELVALLQKDPSTLKENDYKKLSRHFNSKIKMARDTFENDEGIKEKSFDMLVKDILDYRKWFEFKILFQKEGEERRELTKVNYNKLSGGERAMSMYIPLLSALYSKFISASSEAPYVISMDEAFAGVDENNISTMFKLMSDFELNYILNSQALWGTYETVDALSIADIIRPQNTKDVTVMLYKWDGLEKKPVQSDRGNESEIKLTEQQQDMFNYLAEMKV